MEIHTKRFSKYSYRIRKNDRCRKNANRKFSIQENDKRLRDSCICARPTITQFQSSVYNILYFNRIFFEPFSLAFDTPQCLPQSGTWQRGPCEFDSVSNFFFCFSLPPPESANGSWRQRLRRHGDAKAGSFCGAQLLIRVPGLDAGTSARSPVRRVRSVAPPLRPFFGVPASLQFRGGLFQKNSRDLDLRIRGEKVRPLNGPLRASFG